MFDINHLGRDRDQISKSPRISSEGKTVIGGNIPDGAAENDEEGQKGKTGRDGLVSESGVCNGDEEGSERSEYDEGVDVGVTEEVGVGEDGEVEDECGGEEFLGGGKGKRVMVEKP